MNIVKTSRRLKRWLKRSTIQTVLKIKTPAEYDAFVQRIERSAQRHPNRYRFRVGLLAVLGYVYILLVFALLCVIVWGFRQLLIYAQAEYLMEQLNWITCLLIFCLFRMFWIGFPAPKGINLYRQQVPQLFDLIDEVAEALNAPHCHRVLLTDDLNAAIVQRPRFGFLGWHTNYLLLGLPLMQALSPAQFRSVIAHELGHLSGNDGRFRSWVYQVRKVWFDLAEQFETTKRGGFLFRSFFGWYGPFFKAYSFVLARAEEYAADRCAAQVAGTQVEVQSQLNLTLATAFLSRVFWPKVYKQAAQLTDPPDDIIAQMVKELQPGMASRDATKWITLALLDRTDNDDTHPCLADRLAALGAELEPDSVSARLPELLPDSQHTAAQHFFGETLTSLIGQLDTFWKKETAKSWKKHHALLQHQTQRLQDLEMAANRHALTVEECWKRADLTETLKTDKAAVPLYEDVLARCPTHANANYNLGYILLKRNDASGVPYMETALRQDPGLVISACRHLYGFYQQKGEQKLAEQYRQQLQHHAPRWQLAEQERSRLKYDDRFEPHCLAAEEVQQLTDLLASYADIKAAYLVRKTVSLFPEKPFYLLGVVRRLLPGTGATHQTNAEFIERLAAEISFSEALQILIFDRPTSAVWQAFQKVRSASIYVRPHPAME